MSKFDITSDGNLINQQIDSAKTTNRAVFDFSDNYISEIQSRGEKSE